MSLPPERDPFFDFVLGLPANVVDMVTEMAPNRPSHAALEMAPEVSCFEECQMLPEASLNKASGMGQDALYNEALGIASAACSNGDLQPCSNGDLQPCSNMDLQPCSNMDLQPCSNEDLQPCSNEALQPCSNEGLQPCSNEALQPCSNESPQPCSNVVPEAISNEFLGVEQEVSSNGEWDMVEATRLTRSEENQKWRRRILIVEGKIDCLERSLDAVFAQLRSEEAPTREVISSSEYTRMVYEAFARNNSEYGISKLLIRKFLHAHFAIDNTSKYQRRRLCNFLKKEIELGRIICEGELYRLA